MVFNLTKVQSALLLSALRFTDAPQTKQEIRNGSIKANNDLELRFIHKKVIRYSNMLFYSKRTIEAQKYWELAVQIRDMRSQYARREEIIRQNRRLATEKREVM